MPAPQVAVVQMQRPGFCDEHRPIFGEVTCGRALSFRPAMICAGVNWLFALSIRLATPAATGAAKLVPKSRL